MADQPLLYLFHGLGLGSQLWADVCAKLSGAFECRCLDLPGFGDRADEPPADDDELVEGLIRLIRVEAGRPWLIGGHSMGGKVATLVAARALCSDSGVAAPLGIILVAASPPSPEPMDEAQRSKMIGWAADGPLSRVHADEFVSANVSAPLEASAHEALRRDLMRANPHAWTRWLEKGSKEDRSSSVGTLNLPALIVAGADDGPLGEDAQRRLNAPSFSSATLVTIDGAAHLIPVERPLELATQMLDFATQVVHLPGLPTAFLSLLHADRVGERARRVLLDRIAPPPANTIFSMVQRRALAALSGRLLPQTRTAIDLVARVEHRLAAAQGDGWRHADLPPDPAAWRLGLDGLIAALGDPPSCTGQQLDAWINASMRSAAEDPATSNRLSSEQNKLWLQDVRRALVSIWLSHPAAMAAIDYDGFANGGDGQKFQGFAPSKAGLPDDEQSSPSNTSEPRPDGP